MRSILVTVFIPILFLLIGLTACQNRTSDTIIENVRGYTFYDGELGEFSSIAFQGGKVVEVAVEGPLEADPQNAIVIDGDNRVMLPGLIDSHGHVMELGFNEIDVDLAGAPSLDEALERVSTYASKYSEL